jgi:hypothetical protein
MSHMVADLIGFHADGGYLTVNGTHSRFGDVNWVLLWPKVDIVELKRFS